MKFENTEKRNQAICMSTFFTLNRNECHWVAQGSLVAC